MHRTVTCTAYSSLVRSTRRNAGANLLRPRRVTSSALMSHVNGRESTMARKNYTPRGRQNLPRLNLGIFDDASLSNLLHVGQDVRADVQDLAVLASEVRNRRQRARNRNSR